MFLFGSGPRLFRGNQLALVPPFASIFRGAAELFLLFRDRQSFFGREATRPFAAKLLTSLSFHHIPFPSLPAGNRYRPLFQRKETLFLGPAESDPFLTFQFRPSPKAGRFFPLPFPSTVKLHFFISATTDIVHFLVGFEIPDDILLRQS